MSSSFEINVMGTVTINKMYASVRVGIADLVPAVGLENVCLISEASESKCTEIPAVADKEDGKDTCCSGFTGCCGDCIHGAAAFSSA